LASSLAFSQSKKIATVKIIRGDVSTTYSGKSVRLNVNDWIEEGSVVKTADKSFVKIIFIDKSQINIGPSSEIKIEHFSGEEPGLIDLVKGKVRSQVTKDYLNISKGKSKLFITTPNAVIGVRGTDFMISISQDGKNTSTVLFEGEIAMNKLETTQGFNSDKLEQAIQQGVRIHPGEFSVVEQNKAEPTVPAKLNNLQLEILEKNDSFERSPSSSKSEETTKSVVPNGLDGKVVSNEVGTPSESSSSAQSSSDQTSSDPDGYVSGAKIKPANGSFIHIDSGIIIPPGKDSVFDANTNSYIPGPESGMVAEDGSYLPPKDIIITNDGKMMAIVISESGEKKTIEIAKPSPVKIEISSPPIGSVSTNTQTNLEKNGPTISPNDPSRFNSSGGVTNVNDAAQQFTGPRERILNICTGLACP
jgi:hypothetical protein